MITVIQLRDQLNNYIDQAKENYPIYVWSSELEIYIPCEEVRQRMLEMEDPENLEPLETDSISEEDGKIYEILRHCVCLKA